MWVRIDYGIFCLDDLEGHRRESLLCEIYKWQTNAASHVTKVPALISGHRTAKRQKLASLQLLVPPLRYR